MPLKEFSASDVLRITQAALRAVGLSDALAVLKAGNLVGDDDPRCEGYVTLDDGIDIFPQLVGNAVGWGVSYATWIPGCRTMPNGDPGYPDECDVVDVLAPSFNTPGIDRTHTHARQPGAAVDAAIVCMVQHRLRALADSTSYDPEEVECECE